MRIRTLVLATALLFSTVAAVHAHALLKAATPPVGSTIKTVPPDVTIVFSEAVEPKFSSIEVHDAAGARVDKNDVHTAPDNGRRLIVSLQAVPPGTYKVIWHVTSVDTHRTQGSYSFTLAP
jgi:copper resistance protein C